MLVKIRGLKELIIACTMCIIGTLLFCLVANNLILLINENNFIEIIKQSIGTPVFIIGYISLSLILLGILLIIDVTLIQKLIEEKKIA